MRCAITQRVQPSFRLRNAARQRLGIKFLRFARVASRAERSPCRQDGWVIRLGQSEQRRRTAHFGSALEDDPGSADIALA